jgi:hypothetical protein
MFGYIRPLRDELKVREYEQYKACYCGLCRALKAQGTPLSSFILSYDFTFLAMLLYDGQDAPEKSCVRCGANPLKRRKACLKFPALSQCADYCIILTWWKLRDTVDDEGFFRALRDRLLSSVLKRAYKKAAARRPEYAARVREALEALARLEREERPSLDACADQFARLTAALSGGAPEMRRRALEQLLYHVGRFIYIIDASDDLSEDHKAGRRNVVAERFGLIGGVLTDEAREALENTLLHSCRLAAAALELLDPGPFTPVLQNIIYLGMPQVCRAVLSGTWRGGKARKNKEFEQDE